MTVQVKGAEEVIKGFKQLQTNINSSATEMKRMVADVYNKTIERSPVDGGGFKATWDLDEKSNDAGYRYIATITNNMPYAIPIEIGSEIGEKPWPSAGPKTVEYNGRIFSQQVVGEGEAGVIGPALEEAGFETLAETIGDNIMKGV